MGQVIGKGVFGTSCFSVPSQARKDRIPKNRIQGFIKME
jgi:hypothetical protein